MTVFFDKYIQDDIEALGMTGVAAIACPYAIPDPATAQAADSAFTLLSSHQVDRVEFIHRPGRVGVLEYRGALFYDTSSPEPKPFLHVLNALLGYDGSGPDMSRDIMRHLGMSETMFGLMNDSVRGIRSTNQSYVILVVKAGSDWRHDVVRPFNRSRIERPGRIRVR